MSLKNIFISFPFQSMFQTATRGQALDTLPAIEDFKVGLLIKPIETEDTAWRTFLYPLSDELWIAILVIAVVISCLLTGIELMFNSNYSSCLPTCTSNLWIAFKANFGGKPSLALAQCTCARTCTTITKPRQCHHTPPPPVPAPPLFQLAHQHPLY